MELVALYKRVVGLDIHQAQITACALIEEPDGSTRIEQRQFDAPGSVHALDAQVLRTGMQVNLSDALQ